jgi:hypothetical protein
MVGVFSSQALASPAATKTTKTTFTLHCSASIAVGDVSVQTTQVYSPSVKAGSKFTLKWKSVTTVSGQLAAAANAIAPDGSERGTVTLDNDLSTDASPKTNNIAGKKGIKEFGMISTGVNSFKVYTPKTGYETTPSFTAGKKGTEKVSAQDDDATVSIYDKNGKYSGNTEKVICTPVGTPKVIATISVT